VSDLSTIQGSTNVFGRLFARARSALRDLAARHALRQELLECDRSGVLDGVLAEVQMSRGDLEPMIGDYPLSRRLFGAMAARLQVDPRSDGPLMLRALQHTCAVCTHQRECRHWLESGRSEGYDEFCPNADYWHDLKERIRAAAMRGRT
jgi:hypothetical protein